MKPNRMSQLLYRVQRLAPRVPFLGGAIRHAIARASEISVTEARFLGSLAARCQPTEPIVEIGVLFGSSTKVLALFKPSESKLYAVDSFRWNPYGFSRDDHHSLTASILEDAIANQNVELIRSDKSDFYKSYDGPKPGLVFLDARHTYDSTLEDIRWARKAGARMIAGHDYSPKFPGVVDAVNDSGGVSQLVGSLFLLNQ